MLYSIRLIYYHAITHKILFALTLAGLLFSCYLSAVKLFTNTCAFGETCPMVLGYPACWYGFGMYLVMLIVTVLGLVSTIPAATVTKTDAVVSFLGILFAGTLVIQEFVDDSLTGALGLSTCAYGLVFYLLIFVVSLNALRKIPRN